ncbi:hypothetical protein ACOMHN_033873 [Nucella lapillus]
MQWCAVFLSVGALCLLMNGGYGQTDQTDRRLVHREKQRFRLAELSRATTSFSVSLYRQLASRDDENVIFSPFSVFTALSMLLLGTDGSTKDELRTVMAQKPRQGVHQALRAIKDSFPTSQDANITLRVANALYYDDQRISVTNTFTNNLRRVYEAYPRTLERPDPEAPINDWVFRHTGGKIQDFLQPGAITDDTVLILLNAIYFQGTWREIFDERRTREGEFTTSSGQVVRVPMMSRDGQYAVKVLPQVRAQVLELPFGTDNRFSLFIVLPDDPNGLSDVEARLSTQVLEEAVTNMPQPSRTMIHVPRFTLREKTSMKDILMAMGLNKVFQNNAELTRMSSSPLRVSDVRHEAVLEVDEKGAKAAAVTSVEIVLLSLPPSFVANHPFMVILRDNTARLNLFMGRLNHPQAA